MCLLETNTYRFQEFQRYVTKMFFHFITKMITQWRWRENYRRHHVTKEFHVTRPHFHSPPHNSCVFASISTRANMWNRLRQKRTVRQTQSETSHSIGASVNFCFWKLTKFLTFTSNFWQKLILWWRCRCLPWPRLCLCVCDSSDVRGVTPGWFRGVSCAGCWWQKVNNKHEPVNHSSSPVTRTFLRSNNNKVSTELRPHAENDVVHIALRHRSPQITGCVVVADWLGISTVTTVSVSIS